MPLESVSALIVSVLALAACTWAVWTVRERRNWPERALDLLDHMEADRLKLRREWAGVLEELDDVLARVEKKRAQARSAQQRAEKAAGPANGEVPLPMTREDELRAVRAALGGNPWP